MKRQLILSALLAMTIATGLYAEEPEKNLWSGYVFAAVGSSPCGCGTEGQFGGGAQYTFSKGLGLGGEINGIGNESYSLSVFSANVVYRFPTHGKARPFVSGGYSGFTDGYAGANGFNFGGGVDYMVKKHLGARIELRDQVLTSYGYVDSYWGVRFGIAF